MVSFCLAYILVSGNFEKKSRKMKLEDLNKIFLVTIVLTLFSSCLDDKINTIPITGDYYLNWTFEKSEQLLLKSSDEGKTGRIVIPETIFAVGFDKNFIIAKQHPNKEEEISKRLFENYDNVEGYLLKNPKDTIYLATDDSIHKKDGKWYHLSNGWNPADSLKPYRKITYYHIIDLRNQNSKKKNLKDENDFKFDNKNDFEEKRKKLGVPNELNFTIFEKEFE